MVVSDPADLTAENLGEDDEFPEGVQLQLQPRFRDGAMYAQSVVLIHQHEYSEVAWKNVVTAGVLASCVPDLNFAYTEPERFVAVHTSVCSETQSESSHDQELFDAILASGAEFLPGGAPACACLSSSPAQSRLGRTVDYFAISLVSLFTSVPNS